MWSPLDVQEERGGVVLRSWFIGLFDSAMELNRRQILADLPRHGGRLLDLGCDDGDWTMKLASVTPREGVHGVEVVEERAVVARSRGVEVVVADLAHVLPLTADTFDVIHANQVIEHVPDIDLFATEILRLLKPGGLAIVSTENTSSWHNVFAAFCGWQMFSSTNLSGVRLGIGNPLAVHRGESDHVKTWTHKVLFSARGLREFFEAHGFEVVTLRGAGYHPLPAWLGQWDVSHSHFITVLARKPA